MKTPIIRMGSEYGYHPGNLTCDTGGLKQDELPPGREVVTTKLPVLYDADGRPIYRGVGFK